MLKDTVVQSLFDGSGRRVPPQGISGAVNAADRRYILVQPRIDYAEIHRRLAEYLEPTGLASADEFAERAQGLLDDLRRSEETRELANGVRVPFALGRREHADIGQALEEI